MPLRVTRPEIDTPLGGDRDVLLRVTSVPTDAACELFNMEARSSAQPQREWGTYARYILANCAWEVVGVILDQDGAEVQDEAKRRAIAQEACLHDAASAIALTLGVLSHLGAVSGNWRPASDVTDGETAARGAGTD